MNMMGLIVILHVVALISTSTANGKNLFCKLLRRYVGLGFDIYV